MKIIKTSTVLNNFKGVPLKNEEIDLTIGEVLSTALSGKSSNPTLSWVLGKKFATEKQVELKAEDIVFLKKELETSEMWTAIVVGQVLEMLDGSEEK